MAYARENTTTSTARTSVGPAASPLGPGAANQQPTLPTPPANSQGVALDSDLADALRDEFAPGVDAIRVHTGPEAAEFAQQQGARAYVNGTDIYFASGAYGTDTGNQVQFVTSHVLHALSGPVQPGSPPSGASQSRAREFTRTPAAQRIAPLSFGGSGASGWTTRGLADGLDGSMDGIDRTDLPTDIGSNAFTNQTTRRINREGSFLSTGAAGPLDGPTAGDVTSRPTGSDGRARVTYVDANGVVRNEYAPEGATAAEIAEHAANRAADPNASEPSRWQALREATNTTGILAQASVKGTAEADLVEYQREFDGTIGGQGYTGQVEADVGVDGEASANAQLTTSGASARAEAKADAGAEFESAVELAPIELNINGEVLILHLGVMVRAFAGVEAIAALEGRLQWLRNNPPGDGKLDAGQILEGTGLQEGDPAMAQAENQAAHDNGRGASVTGEVGAFVGGRVTLGASATMDWQRKEASEYTSHIEGAADLITTIVAGGNPAVAWIFSQVGVDEVIEHVVSPLFQWESARTVSVARIMAQVEGSAGAGARAMASASFQAGRLRFQAGASATWGLGLGAQVNVDLHLVEGGRFALIMMGDLANLAQQFLQEQSANLTNSVGDLFQALSDWFSADDKAREAVANGVHTLPFITAQQRGTWIANMVSGWTGEEDQDAIVAILRVSEQRGDLGAVLAAGSSANSILWDLDGAQDREARRIMAAFL